MKAVNNRTERLQEKITKLKIQMKQLSAIKGPLGEALGQQIFKTDPDARSMRTRGSGIVGYNVRTVSDSKNHLIVDHEVTNEPNDRDQLFNMAINFITLARYSLMIIPDQSSICPCLLHCLFSSLSHCSQAFGCERGSRCDCSDSRNRGAASRNDYVA